MERMEAQDLYVLRYDPYVGTVMMYDAFCLLDVRVEQGRPVPFDELMLYDHRFLRHSSIRHAALTEGEPQPQADGEP
jgi:hypothetical protein